MVKACVWVSNFRQEDVRDREFEGERGMERHIDKHAFRAGIKPRAEQDGRYGSQCWGGIATPKRHR